MLRLPYVTSMVTKYIEGHIIGFAISPTYNFLLLENGFYLLTESLDEITLER